jgi:hypothetical protein
VVQQTRPLERPLALVDIDRAGPEREEAPDEVHCLVDAAGRGVRPKIPAAVPGQLSRALDAREVVAQGDLDEGVALVVLEPHIEARLEALDEVRLEEEGLAHVVGQGDLDIDDTVQRGLDPEGHLAGAALLPVGAHATAQALCLADVQDASSGVAHEVDARLVGQVGQDRGELRSHRAIVRDAGVERRSTVDAGVVARLR